MSNNLVPRPAPVSGTKVEGGKSHSAHIMKEATVHYTEGSDPLTHTGPVSINPLATPGWMHGDCISWFLTLALGPLHKLHRRSCPWNVPECFLSLKDNVGVLQQTHYKLGVTQVTSAMDIVDL